MSDLQGGDVQYQILFVLAVTAIVCVVTEHRKHPLTYVGRRRRTR